MDRMKAFLEALSGPEAKELLKAQEKPADLQEACAVYAQTAKQLGIDVTEEEIRTWLSEQEAGTRERTDAAIRTLPDDAVEAVAGGIEPEHAGCQYSYKNKENCWYSDGCDFAWIHYDGYYCHLLEKG